MVETCLFLSVLYVMVGFPCLSTITSFVIIMLAVKQSLSVHLLVAVEVRSCYPLLVYLLTLTVNHRTIQSEYPDRLF